MSPPDLLLGEKEPPLTDGEQLPLIASGLTVSNGALHEVYMQGQGGGLKDASNSEFVSYSLHGAAKRFSSQTSQPGQSPN
jgi:hypothetical protein